jgi:hypothetical protein
MKTAPSTISTTPTYYPQATSAKRSVAMVPVPTTAQHSSMKKNQKPTNASSKKPDNTMPMWVPVALMGSSIGVVAFVAWLANKKNPHLPPKLETEAEPLAEAIAETENLPDDLKPLVQEMFAYVGATPEGKELIRLAVERKVKFEAVKNEDLPLDTIGRYVALTNTIKFPERTLRSKLLFVSTLAHELVHAPQEIVLPNGHILRPSNSLKEEQMAEYIARSITQQLFEKSELLDTIKLFNFSSSTFDLTPKALVEFGNGYKWLPKELLFANVPDILEHGGFGNISGLIDQVSEEATKNN